MSFLHIVSFSIFQKPSLKVLPPRGVLRSFKKYGFWMLPPILLVGSILSDGSYREGSIAWAGGSSLSGESFLQKTDIPVLTIDQAVSQALQKNPALAKDLARINREKTLSIQAGELPDPKLVLGEQYFPISFNM
ncbi:MAG: TolC family protein, partial [Nitrospiraceae bacterium]|nr:TolC family protein [Nitrospiraceae bacterium]